MGVYLPTGDRTAVKRTADFFLSAFAVCYIAGVLPINSFSTSGVAIQHLKMNATGMYYGTRCCTWPDSYPEVIPYQQQGSAGVHEVSEVESSTFA